VQGIGVATCLWWLALLQDSGDGSAAAASTVDAKSILQQLAERQSALCAFAAIGMDPAVALSLDDAPSRFNDRDCFNGGTYSEVIRPRPPSC
jgi:hypothetical protein